MKHILITGGAGFIGSNLTRALRQKGHKVTILDNLSPQIHGADATYKPPQGVRFIKGDVVNKKDWKDALKNVDIVVHLAAETGTGQSMYEVHKYAEVNISGTALLLDHLVNEPHSVQKVIVASSRAIYGEGKYSCEQHGIVYPESRQDEHMAKGQFDPVCEHCGKQLQVLPTDEASKIHPSSVYGITKLNQEQMVLNVCKSIGIPAIAYRYQNVYGPGQSLKNPYTGILSIFSTQIRNGNDINIFEDGLESRDFVYIDDIVKATVMGIESDFAGQKVFNVGSGEAVSVMEVATKLKEHYAADISIHVTGNYRLGDIRHNLADLGKISEGLNFKPDWSFDRGISQFCRWVLEQEINPDRYEQSVTEMKSKGLLK